MWRQLQEHVLANPIQAKFQKLKDRREAALITYLTGGDPDFESSEKNLSTMIEAGADIVEIGIPFSDPIADGPINQASSSRALAGGATPSKVLDSVKGVSTKYRDTPFVVLTYYNPIIGTGVERFLAKCKDSGVSGVIVPDLPLEEAADFRAAALKYHLDDIHQVAPNTSSDRIMEIIERTRGFLYLVPLYGVTGPRQTLSPQSLEMVRKVKGMSRGSVPVAVGFGVSSSDHVSSYVRSGADGVIVGSALVEIIAKHKDGSGKVLGELTKVVADLKQATRNVDFQISSSGQGQA